MVDEVISDYAFLDSADFFYEGSVQDIGIFTWMDYLHVSQEKRENGFFCEDVLSSGGITCKGSMSYVGKHFFLIMIRLFIKALSP